jgi:hypothetical protein
MGEEKVMRKIDPTLKRKDIKVLTLKKVEQFLKEQDLPVFKSEIQKQCGVDFHSVGIALTMINHEVDDKGRIKIKNV